MERIEGGSGERGKGGKGEKGKGGKGERGKGGKGERGKGGNDWNSLQYVTKIRSIYPSLRSVGQTGILESKQAYFIIAGNLVF